VARPAADRPGRFRRAPSWLGRAAGEQRAGARTGKGDGEVIEEALRRELGFDVLDRLWQRSDLPEHEATALAVEAQHKTRRRPR